MCTNNRVVILWFLLLTARSGTLGVADEVKPFDKVPGWGQVVDPAGDCAFSHEGNTFTIRVPGTEHNLWPLKGKVNAPLVLQQVEGEFTVEVLVRSVEKAEQDTALPGLASKTAFHAGTLVIWHDAKNFVRLDRTDMNKDGRPVTSCYFHIFKEGKRIVELAPVVSDRPTLLRLARKGGTLTASYSQDDGQSWKSFPEQTIDLPSKLRTGVSALNSTVRSMTVKFERLKITQ